jgi:hypothetical protein
MGPIGQPTPQLLNAIQGAYGGRRGFMEEPKKEIPLWQKLLGVVGGLGLGGLAMKSNGLGGLASITSPLLGAIQGIQSIFKQFNPEDQGAMGQNRPQSLPLYNYRRG